MSEAKPNHEPTDDSMTVDQLRLMEFFLRSHLRRRLFPDPSNPPTSDLMLGRLVDLVCQLRVAAGAREISAQRLWELAAMGDEASVASKMSNFKSGAKEDKDLAARAEKMVGSVLLGENRKLLRIPTYTRRPLFLARDHATEKPAAIATRIMRLLFSEYRPRSTKSKSESQAPDRQGFLKHILPVPLNSYEARSELIALGFLARCELGRALVVRCSGMAGFPQTKPTDGQLTRSGEETINLLSHSKTAVIYVYPKGTEAQRSFCAFRDRAVDSCTQRKVDPRELSERLIAVELPPEGSSVASPMFRWIWHQVVEPNHEAIEALSGTATVRLGPSRKANEDSFDPAKEALDAFPHLLIQRFPKGRETIEPFPSTAFDTTSDEKDRFREVILSQVWNAAKSNSQMLQDWPDPCAEVEA